MPEDATNPTTTSLYQPGTDPFGLTIFVRVQSGVTGCYATFPMELIVVEAPTIGTPNPLERFVIQITYSMGLVNLS